MNAHALTYPGLWPAGTPDLGTLDLTYVPRIADASHHWSSRQLPAGKLTAWTDRVSGAVLAPPSVGQAPTVYAGLRKVVRFGGSPERVQMPLDLKGPLTMAIVAGIQDDGAGRFLTYGLDGGTFWNFYQGSNGNWAFSGGKTLSSTRPADSGRHVFMIAYDGPRSVLRIDDQEWTGDAGTTPAAGFRIGSHASGYFRLDVESIVILPFAANASRRAGLTNQLKKEHGFTF